MKEARQRIDEFEAQETASAAPTAPARLLPTLIFWITLVVVGAAIYFLAAWYQQP
jgi:hypothetical protein